MSHGTESNDVADLDGDNDLDSNAEVIIDVHGISRL